MKTNKALLLVLGLTSFTFLSGLALSSSSVSADNDSVVDEINITVPSSCNLTGIGNTSHTATINNGTYVSDIGTTTIKAFCNDQEGFAIYAIGYTDDTDGKNVLTSSVLGSTHDIATGTGTSGNSQWAMKLSTQTSPEPDYPITIQNSFDSFHTVPDDYTLVAKRTASTDVGTNAIGSTLTSTYQVYISQTQSAGTYVGQVKYVLVHPNYVDSGALNDAVTVVFDGNGFTFPNGQTTNTVKYANVCKPGGYGYVANTPYTTVGTSNLNSDGTQKQESPSYTDSENILQTITVPNADKVKVVVDYGITDGVIMAIKGAWDGNSEPDEYQIIVDAYEKVGTGTAVLDGNEVTLLMNVYGVAPEPGYDYGAYFKIYAVYDTEQPGTTGEELPSNDCSIMPISGNYVETSEWHGKWIASIDGDDLEFAPVKNCRWEDWCETDNTTRRAVETFIVSDYDLLSGTSIVLQAYNPVTFDDVYAAANKAKVNGYYKIQDLTAQMCSEVSAEETTTVIDIRDNNTYSIGKLADGNCWLRDNLRLNPTDATTAANMSASNTNATDDAIYNYLNGGNSNNNAGWTSVAVSNPNSWMQDAYNEPYIHISEDSSYGVYYNYCAVSLGTYCYTPIYNVGGSVYGNALYDVCPSNWSLPTRSQLYSSSLKGRALNATSSGYYDPDNNEIEDEWQGGYYWSSSYSTYGGTTMKAALCNNGADRSCKQPYSNDDVLNKTYGASVRCVLSTSD